MFHFNKNEGLNVVYAKKMDVGIINTKNRQKTTLNCELKILLFNRTILEEETTEKTEKQDLSEDGLAR